MMNISQMARTGLDVLTDNAPAILTAFGAVGVVGTAVLTGKASFEAADRIQQAQIEANIDNGVHTPLTRNEKIKLIWPLYVIPAATGATSIAAIVMSHRISSRRAAVLAAAYALNQDKLEEYQDKVKEKLGIKKEKAVRDEIAQDRVNSEYDSAETIFSPLDGKVLIREDYTGRYFWGTVEDIKHAVNEINHHILTERSARLSDFYDLIGLDHVSTSDYFGFTGGDMLEIDWSTCTTPDGKMAVHSFEYVNHPVMNPEREASFL